MTVPSISTVEDRADDLAPSRPTVNGAVVAGSLGCGALVALLLVAVVFPGGPESTLTGAILTGFGLGWALLGGLATRKDRRQRWLLMPAAAMTLTGAALLTFAPDVATMDNLSWIWPPVVLALGVWTLAQTRRTLTGRGRGLVCALTLILIASAAGALVEDVATLGDPEVTSVSGATYDVGGHRLYLDCHGVGGPTVVLDNGLGESAATWDLVVEGVASTTRVCAYDRAGQGWSDPVDVPQDGQQAAADLQALLARAGEAGPFVLVGHSTGGTYAMTYAVRYPDQVAGMVLLDSSSPEQLTAIPSFSGEYGVTRRVIALLPTMARLGVARLFGSSTRALTSMRDEQSVLPEVFAQAQDLTSLHDRPLAVVTASENLTVGGWAAAQAHLATLSSNAVHLTSPSSHVGLLEDERGAADSVRAISAVVHALRVDAPLDPS